MHAHFKNRQNCYSNHHTAKPHHLPSQSSLFQPEAKPICTSPLHKESSILHRLLLLYSGNASKATHDVRTLFNLAAKVWLDWLFSFLCLFIYLTSGVLEQSAVMLEKTSKIAPFGSMSFTVTQTVDAHR